MPIIEHVAMPECPHGCNDVKITYNWAEQNGDWYHECFGCDNVFTTKFKVEVLAPIQHKDKE